MEIKYKNNTVYFPQKELCVISDLHIGLEDKLIEQGISFPFNELNHLKKDLEPILKEFNPKKVVYNGDILHKFSDIPPAVPKKLKKITELPEGDQIFLKGSHDTMLDPILKDIGYSSKKEYHTDNLLITHGHERLNKIDPKNYKYLILGHEHPAIEIHGEKKDCYLLNKECINNTNILILPSFSSLSEGVKINRLKNKDFMSPYLNNCLVDNYYVTIETKEEVLEFPKLRDFRKKL